MYRRRFTLEISRSYPGRSFGPPPMIRGILPNPRSSLNGHEAGNGGYIQGKDLPAKRVGFEEAAFIEDTRTR